MRQLLKKFSVIMLMLMMVISTSGITVGAQDEHQDDMAGYVLASKYNWNSGYVYEKGLGSEVVKISAGSNTTSVSFNSTILIYAVRVKSGNDFVDVLYPNGVFTGTVNNINPVFSNGKGEYHDISHVVFYTKTVTPPPPPVLHSVKIVKDIIADEQVEIPTEAASAEFDFEIALKETTASQTFTLTGEGSKDFLLPAGEYTLKEVSVDYSGTGSLDSIYTGDQLTFKVPENLVNGQIVFQNKYLPPVVVQKPIPVKIQKTIDNIEELDLPDAVFNFRLIGTGVDKTFSITNEGYATETFELMPGAYTLEEVSVTYPGPGRFESQYPGNDDILEFVVPTALTGEALFFEVSYGNDYIAPEEDPTVKVRIAKDVVTSTFPSGAEFKFLLTGTQVEYSNSFSILNEGFVELYLIPGLYTLTETGTLYTGAGSFASAETNNAIAFEVSEASEEMLTVTYRNTYTAPVIPPVDEDEDPEEGTEPPVVPNPPATTNPPVQETTVNVVAEAIPLNAANSFMPFDFDSNTVAPIEETTEVIEVVDVDDEETPLATALPQTGQIPTEVFVGIGGLISALGVFLKKK